MNTNPDSWESQPATSLRVWKIQNYKMQECNHRLHLDDCSPDLRPDSDPNNTSQPTTTARDSPPSTTPRGHPTTSPPPDEESPTQTPADIEQGFMKITQVTYENETRGFFPHSYRKQKAE